MWAHVALGICSSWFGELALAQTHLEQGLALYDRRAHFPSVGTSCLVNLAYVYWRLGYPERALRKEQEALALAQERNEPFSLAYAFYGAAVLHDQRGEKDLAQQRAEIALQIARDHELGYWISSTVIFSDWALAEHGRVEEGIGEIRRGLSLYQSMNKRPVLPYFLFLLASACRKAERQNDAFTTVREAQELVATTAHTKLQFMWEGRARASTSLPPRAARTAFPRRPAWSVRPGRTRCRR